MNDLHFVGAAKADNNSSLTILETDRYHILVEFAHKHLDFQMEELESVLDMHGITLDSHDCRIESVPSQDEATAHRHRKLSTTSRRPFLRLSLPLDSKWLPPINENPIDPDEVTPTAQPKHIASIIRSRCRLVRNVMELWGMGPTLNSCVESTKQWISTEFGKSIYCQVADASQAWKISVHTLGTKFTSEEQAGMREHFRFLDLKGKVRLSDPDHDMVIIREVEMNALGSPVYPRRNDRRELIPENVSRPPLACYFVRSLCGSRIIKGRGIEKFSLRNRKYLGPTSMDAELSFIMTNMAQVKKSSFVLDPFVGTGSILLSCALRGSYCIGTDIDIRVLRGLGKEENVISNFLQFGLPLPELVRSDNSIYHRHFRTDHCLYDAIVTDPPYGIRAGARKTGSRKEEPHAVPEEHRHDHIAQTRPYDVSDVMSDLLDMAARTLVMGGRLVYIIPSFQDFEPKEDLPRHPCLKLLYQSFQHLGSELGRRMITMEKVEEYDPAKRDSYVQDVWVNGAASAEKCANIREKIAQNAKLRPDYETKLEHRKQKRRKTKEDRKAAKLTASQDTKA